MRPDRPDCQAWRENGTRAAALACVRDGPGAFFDGCRLKCVADLELASFGRDNHLEHFVYGRVSDLLAF